MVKLVSDGTHWFIYNRQGEIQGGRPPLNCPDGFIEVPGNSVLGTNDFCVMQFEAKRNSGRAVSAPAGTPWVSIFAASAQSTCESIPLQGRSGTYTLISNPEWMTIARNAEATAGNWSGSGAMQGNIFQGHSDGTPNNALAVTNVNNPYDGTGQSSGNQRRTLELSNGQTIWDFAGNVREWVDWDATQTGFTRGPTDASYSSRALNMLVGSVTANDVSPVGTYSPNPQSVGLGVWYSGDFSSSRGVTVRGNYWRDTTGGVFRLNLYQTNSSGTFIGFRCVFRPE